MQGQFYEPLIFEVEKRPSVGLSLCSIGWRRIERSEKGWGGVVLLRVIVAVRR